MHDTDLNAPGTPSSTSPCTPPCTSPLIPSSPNLRTPQSDLVPPHRPPPLELEPDFYDSQPLAIDEEEDPDMPTQVIVDADIDIEVKKLCGGRYRRLFDSVFKYMELEQLVYHYNRSELLLFVNTDTERRLMSSFMFHVLRPVLCTQSQQGKDQRAMQRVLRSSN